MVSPSGPAAPVRQKVCPVRPRQADVGASVAREAAPHEPVRWASHRASLVSGAVPGRERVARVRHSGPALVQVAVPVTDALAVHGPASRPRHADLAAPNCPPGAPERTSARQASPPRFFAQLTLRGLARTVQLPLHVAAAFSVRDDTANGLVARAVARQFGVQLRLPARPARTVHDPAGQPTPVATDVPARGRLRAVAEQPEPVQLLARRLAVTTHEPAGHPIAGRRGALRFVPLPEQPGPAQREPLPAVLRVAPPPAETAVRVAPLRVRSLDEQPPRPWLRPGPHPLCTRVEAGPACVETVHPVLRGPMHCRLTGLARPVVLAGEVVDVQCVAFATSGACQRQPACDEVRRDGAAALGLGLGFGFFAAAASVTPPKPELSPEREDSEETGATVDGPLLSNPMPSHISSAPPTSVMG